MNTLFAHAARGIAGEPGSMPAGGWRLDGRRAMSLRPHVPSRLHITQGRAWVTLGQAAEGAGNASGDWVLAAGDSLWVPAGARLVMEPWQAHPGPVRFDWCAVAHVPAAAQPDRFGREVLAPSRELAAALRQAGEALTRLVRGLLGYSEYLFGGRGRVLTPFESHHP